MLIPYFRIPLSSEKRVFEIEEIVIGPTPHAVQSSRSVQGLLTKYDGQLESNKAVRGAVQELVIRLPLEATESRWRESA